MKILPNKRNVLILCFVCTINYMGYSQSDVSLIEKYNNYRDRLFSEFVLISPQVEQFGVNLPAVDRRIDKEGNALWVSWSDGNSNYNQWLGLLVTEYRLLKNNGEDYRETLTLLLYAMTALERIDLYSEYLLRKHHNKYIVYDGDTLFDYILLPDDINGFLIRDDVSLGFWKQYHKHFKAPYGTLNQTADGTSTYRSVFMKGVIPKQGMSQDNIFYLMQTLAMINKLAEPECIKDIDLIFQNDIIPHYLKEKNIIINDSVYFDRWVKDLTHRFVTHIRQEYPSPEICLKPFRGNWRARPSKHNCFSFICSRWYIMNPVTDTIVREGNGEDMGVMVNSYGAAEAANKITGTQNYHYDNSDKGLSKYLFESLLFKSFGLLTLGGIPVPEQVDDYMFRSLATIADINRRSGSYELMHLLRDRRPVKTYEHNPLILFVLHRDKYEEIYSEGISYYEEDRQFYKYLLDVAPKKGTTTDLTVEDHHPYWTSSSRLTWPRNEGRVTTPQIWDYAGMDYMYLYNLYKLVFDESGYYLRDNRVKPLEEKFYEKYPVPAFDSESEYNHMPPKIIRRIK